MRRAPLRSTRQVPLYLKVVFIIFERILSLNSVCTFTTNSGDLSTKQPLLLRAGTNELLQPTKDDQFIVDVGSSIDLACTAAFESPLSGKQLTATCVKDDIFSINGQQLQIKDIQCTAAIARSTRETNRTCYDNSMIVEVGFSVDNLFVTSFEVCHNIEKAIAYYAHHSLYPSSAYFQTAVTRPSFIKGGFYKGVDVDGMYTQAKQQTTFADILGPTSQQYFDIPANLYLSRGHLAAKAEFILAPSQIATFFYVNVAPAWQSFNAGNWGRIEDGVRKFANDRKLNLEVYTGAWGVSMLPNSDGQLKELYLGFTSDNKGLVPVPRLFYKVLIDRATNMGIVLIGVNNPFLTLEDIESNEIICNDVSENIDWINWDKTNINRGYSYACDVNDFVKVVEDLPDITVSGLLY